MRQANKPADTTENQAKTVPQQQPPRWTGKALDGYSSTDVLAMLLERFVPHIDATQTARKLMNHLGSLSSILNTNADVLKTAGCDDITIQWLIFLQAFYYRYRQDCVRNPSHPIRFDSPEAFGEYCVNQLSHQFNEVLLIVYLDKENTLLYQEMLFSRCSTRIEINAEQIARTALLYHASSVALAHNHSNGELVPSADDISATERTQCFLAYLNISLLAHFIVANKQFCSVIEQDATNQKFAQKSDQKSDPKPSCNQKPSCS